MSLLKKAISITANTHDAPAPKTATVATTTAATAPAHKTANKSANKPASSAKTLSLANTSVTVPAASTSVTTPVSDAASPLDVEHNSSDESENHINHEDDNDNEPIEEEDDDEEEEDIHHDVDIDTDAAAPTHDTDDAHDDVAAAPARPKRPSEQFCRLTDRMKRLQRYVMYVLCGADLPELAGRFSTEEIVRILKLAEPVKAQVKMLAPANPPTRHMPGAAELPTLPKVVKPVVLKKSTHANKKRKANIHAAASALPCKKHVLKFNPDEPITNIPHDDNLSLIHPDSLSTSHDNIDVDICIVKPIRILDQHFLIDDDNLLYSHLGDDPRPIGKLVNFMPSLF